jgi:hypothetical protein
MEPVVYDASQPVDDWDGARFALMAAFAASQEAARNDLPIVYVVHGDDLLGRRGAPSAMVATGLLSAARTAAIELARAGTPVNVVAVGDDTGAATIERWTRILAERDGPTGELVRLDAGHLGKALP